jgi:hypothetical protein
MSYLFICSVFKDALGFFPDCTELNARMVVNNELERIWKAVVVAYFKLLSHNFLGGTEEMCLGIWCVLRYS